VNKLRSIWKRIRSIWRRCEAKREIDEELRFHLEQRTAENLAAGMVPAEAASEARKKFGNWQSVREECRAARGASFGDTLLQDVGFGLRMLAKSPGFTAVAVVSLALGIGANTAIFSLINGLLLRSLPVRNPHELRVINWTGQKTELSNFTGNMKKRAGGATSCGSFPYPAYRDFRDRAQGFSDVFAFCSLYNCTLVAKQGAVTLEGMMVSGNFFRGYGTTAFLGRTLLPEDEAPGSPAVAVITYRVWERQFGMDPQVIGEAVTLNKSAFTVVGVLPRDHVGPLTGDMAGFYAPMSAQPQLLPGYPLDSPSHWWVQVMGRLAPNADEAQARAALEVQFLQVLNNSNARIQSPGILVEDGRRGPMMEKLAAPALALQSVVALVLLVACVNLASLLLARGAVRRHEMAVRALMGAGRGRLIRQLLTESLMLALLGAGAGFLFATWAKAGLLGLLQQFDSSFHVDARTDFNVLLFTVAATALTALLCGALPALRASRVDPARELQGGRSALAPRLRLSRALVVGQIALSLLLVTGAGLLVRTLINLRQVNPGFAAENLLLFRLDAAQAGYQGQRLLNFYDDVRQSVAAIPGVHSVAMSHLALLGQRSLQSHFTIPGRAAGTENGLQAHVLSISDGYFSTMGIALLRGRDFNTSDTGQSLRAVVVNETFARTLLPGVEAIGRSIRCGNTDYEIVGVCCDAKYDSLRNEMPPTVYNPCRQDPPGAMVFDVRTVLPPQSLVPAVHKIVETLDPTIPLAEVTTQAELLERSLMAERLFTRLCVSLAGLALVLCCIGVHGLMAYNVARRTHEFGVRLALGATPARIARPIVREALLLAGTGLVVGVPMALGLGRVVRSVLYNVAPYDPLTLLCGVFVLLAVAALAAWLPARRAAKTEPMIALRCE
jgi:predicted permease